MEIIQTTENKEKCLDLILQTDPDISVVNKYLNNTNMFVITENSKVVSKIIITKVDNDTC